MPPVTSKSSESASTIRHERKPGVDLTLVNRLGLKELHFTLQPLPGERPANLLWRLDALLREHEAVVVRHEIFGALDVYEETMSRLEKLSGDLFWPVTWTEGLACSGSPIAGMHVFAVSGAKVETLHLEGRVVGRIFNDGLAKHCLLGDIRPADLSASQPAQSGQVFENIEAALDRAGMRMTDLVRTWLHMDDILSWYGPFNVVRKEFFAKRNLFDHLVPASTGVGARNPAGAAMVAGAWAMKPLDDRTTAHEASSPLQCPAPNYGSCFSRAVDIKTPNHRRLLISGTASIDYDGNSIHDGDIKSQIECTMDVVEAILRSREMNYASVSRATAYLKKLEHGAAVLEWCAARGVNLPLLCLQSAVCRDELLFELELDAMIPLTSRAKG